MSQRRSSPEQTQPGRRCVETSGDVIGSLLCCAREAVKIICETVENFSNRRKPATNGTSFFHAYHKPVRAAVVGFELLAMNCVRARLSVG